MVGNDARAVLLSRSPSLLRGGFVVVDDGVVDVTLVICVRWSFDPVVASVSVFSCISAGCIEVLEVMVVQRVRSCLMSLFPPKDRGAGDVNIKVSNHAGQAKASGARLASCRRGTVSPKWADKRGGSKIVRRGRERHHQEKRGSALHACTTVVAGCVLAEQTSNCVRVGGALSSALLFAGRVYSLGSVRFALPLRRMYVELSHRSALARWSGVICRKRGTSDLHFV